MPQRLAELRPATEVVLLDDVGHWPSIEVPDRVAAEISRLA
jgi:pimeloyl-ACP methyl ester carboxylesterase